MLEMNRIRQGPEMQANAACTRPPQSLLFPLTTENLTTRRVSP
jgi:hypothetical protein